jgi:hypothetical protein
MIVDLWIPRTHPSILRIYLLKKWAWVMWGLYELIRHIKILHSVQMKAKDSEK